MSKGDKRHFSLYSRSQGIKSKQYVRLYDMILQQNKFDEKELKIQIGDKYYAQLKYELCKHILESLRRNHHKTDKSSTLLTIDNAHVLLNNGLWKDALKQLKKVFNTQHPIQSNTAFLAFSDTSYIKSRYSTNEVLLETIESWDQRKTEIIELFDIETSYDKLYMKIMLINQEMESVRKPQDKKRLHDYLEDTLLQEPEYSKSKYAELNFHYCNGLARYLLGEYENSQSHMASVKNILDTEYSIRLNREDLYLRVLANLSLCALQNNKITEATSYRKELCNYDSLYAANDSYKIYLTDLLELMICNASNKYKKSFDVISNQLSRSIKHKPQYRLTQEHTYQIFQTVTSYMELGLFKDAKKTILSFITENKKSSKKDAYSYARIVLLIVLIEENNSDLLDFELRSVNRYLKLENQLFLFEKIILDFTNKLIQNNSGAARKKIYRNLSLEIEKLKKSPFERNAFVYFDFDKWAKKKAMKHTDIN